MSEVKVNKISPRSGTAITLGDSGDTFTIPSGATLAIAGSVTGFTSAGIDDNATSVAITIDSSERVGIGNTSPTGALDVKSSTQPQLKVATASATADRNAGFLVTASNSATAGSRSVVVSLDADGGDGSGTDNLTITKTGGDGDATITNQNNAGLVFGANNTEIMRLTGGKAVIGKTTVDSEIANLMLFGTSPGTSSAGQLGIQGSETTGAANTGAGIAFKGHNGSGNRNFGDLKCQKENSSSGDNLSYMSFATRNASGVAERLRISSSGLVGIGTSSPSEELEVSGAQNTIIKSKTTTSTALGGFEAHGSASSYIKVFQHGPSFGGTTFGGVSGNDQSLIEAQAASSVVFSTQGNAGGSNPDFIFAPQRSQKVIIKSDGKVGIGISSPSTTLDVAGDATITKNDTPLYLNRTSSDGEVLRFSKDGTQVGQAAVKSSNLYISSNSSNNTGFKINPNAITPAASNGTDRDNAIDLGSSSARYKDIYLGGGLLVGGTGTANKLDDYEEGDWTPAIKISGDTAGINYSAQVGRYTKIGNRVIANCEIGLSAKGSNTGNVALIGLPFATDNDAHQTGVALNDRVSAPNGDVQVYLNKNNTTGSFYQSRTDGNNNNLITGNEMNATSYLLISFTYRTNS